MRTRFIRHYERRSSATKALFWGLVVANLDFCIDLVESAAPHSHRVFVSALGSIVLGGLFAGVVWTFVDARDRMLKKRFQEIGYLNHHVRNALAIIYMTDERKRVMESCTRIQECVEKMTRRDDCAVSNDHPGQP